MADTSLFGDLLEPGFREIYYDRFSEVPMKMESIFHVKNSSKQDEKDSSVSGFGYLQELAQEEAVQYEDPIQGFDKTYRHKKYGKGFKITEEMYDDDLYNIMNKKPAALARSTRRTFEYQGASVFNNAFSTSYLGGDSKPLVSTSHPRTDGGTAQSNASATGVVFNEPNLEVARLASLNQLDEKGMKIDVTVDTILVNPALGKSAHLVVDSPLRSGTADNDVNVNKGNWKIIEWIYLSSTTAWFLLDSKLHELTWFFRKRPTFKQYDAFDTDVAKYKVTTRFSNGWSDYRGVWGSKGDTVAYAS